MEVTGNGCKSCVIRCTLESLRNNASGLGLCCYCLSKLGKSKHQEPLIRSESNRAAGLSSCVDCADHRKARRSCQIANRSIVVFTTNSRLHRCVWFTVYSNRWSWNSRLLNVHDIAFFALGLMKDSARESLSYYLTASLRDKCS